MSPGAAPSCSCCRATQQGSITRAWAVQTASAGSRLGGGAVAHLSLSQRLAITSRAGPAQAPFAARLQTFTRSTFPPQLWRISTDSPVLLFASSFTIASGAPSVPGYTLSETLNGEAAAAAAGSSAISRVATVPQRPIGEPRV